MSLYKCAVIGAGRIGSSLEDDTLRPSPCTHAGAFHHHEKTLLIAGCDIDKNKRIDFCNKWKIDCYKNYLHLLREEKPDIISISSWTNTHYEILKNSIISGIKGIICEKPMVLSLKQGLEIYRLAKKFNTKIIINHSRRYEPRYIQVKELIKNGILGEIRTIYGNILTGLPLWAKKERIHELSGGPLSHDGTHLMDIFCYFLGRPQWINAQIERKSSKYFCEDRAFGSIGFKNNTIAIFETGGRRKYYNFEIDIQGTKGRIIIGNSKFQLFTAQPSPRYEKFIELKKDKIPKFYDNRNFFLKCIDDIINSIEQNCLPKSSHIDGYYALECIEGIYLSHIKKKKIKIPVKATSINYFQKLAQRWK